MLRSRPENFRAAAVLAVGSSLILGGCGALDKLLSVEAPATVEERDLESPSSASLLVRSAENEFRCAVTHYINVSALYGSEFAVPSNSASLAFYDQRRWTTSGFPAQYAQRDCEDAVPGLYLPLSRARWLADEVLKRLDGWGPQKVAQKPTFEAQVAAYAGYAYLLMGESMCSVAFDEGVEQTPADAFGLAIARFDLAMTAAAAARADRFLNLARVGKARALLNLGRKSDAAAVAAQVPNDFAFTMSYSGGSTATYNKQWELNHLQGEATVEAPYRRMAFAGVPDPRVKVTDTKTVGTGGGLPIWTADKYAGANSPVELATWQEARLIVAEAAVADGRLQQAVDIINDLHARVGLPRFQSSRASEIMDQIIYERRAELFLEGHHFMDIKRYNLALDPAPGEIFPWGGTYGDLNCYPLPAVEYLNNPNITRQN